jgi:hypothetical protein
MIDNVLLSINFDTKIIHKIFTAKRKFALFSLAAFTVLIAYTQHYSLLFLLTTIVNIRKANSNSAIKKVTSTDATFPVQLP